VIFIRDTINIRKEFAELFLLLSIFLVFFYRKTRFSGDIG